MFITVKGLVLKRTRFNENHAYIRVITESGLMTFSAFGVMSPKNKNFAPCQPYTLSEFVLQKKGDSLTLSSASTISHLIKQGVDFEALSYANYISSMASDTAFDEEDAPRIYSLTVNALALISRGGAPLPIIKAVFELRLMAGIGFLPDLEECFSCSEKVVDGYFSVSDGALLCKECEPRQNTYLVRVTKPLIDAMAHLFALDDKSAFGIRFSDPVSENAFVTLAERFSREHLDCATGALNFLKENLQNF